MNQDQTFLGAYLKVERANHHINNIEDCLRAFLRSQPYNMRVEVDAKTAQNFLRFQATKDIPNEVALIIGDATHNLRSALDIMIAEVYRQMGENDSSARFPFHENRDNLIDTISKGIENIAPELASLILAHMKPHKGGNDLLWSLNKLSVMDKHRLLIPVMGAIQLSGVHLEDENQNIFSDITLTVAADGRLLTPIATSSPLKIKHYGKPAITISFAEGQPLQGQPVVRSLREIAQLVLGIVKTTAALYVAVNS